MKFNNETLKDAVKQWLNDASSAEATYGHISGWDTSGVTDMRILFNNAYSFNQPIGDWDVSNVTNMNNMFFRTASFNQPIGNWDVSNVIDMGGMFAQALNFNQPIGDWDVSNVIDMGGMFAQALNFNQPIGDWDVSKVTNMKSMFLGAGAFNQSIENWKISSETDIRDMLHGSGLEKNTIKMEEFHYRLLELEKQNDIINTEKEFDINGKLIDHNEIGFNDNQLKRAYEYWTENPEKAEVKYGHISSWDTSNVTDITEIYFKALETGIDISGWKLKFKENGLVFEKNKSGDFIVFHQNGKKRIQYSKVEFNDQYWYSNLESKFETTKDTKISIFDENETPLNEVTIFLTPNKGDSLIVFRTLIENYTKFHDGNFVETDFLSEYINRRKHIINLTGADELDLQKYPPVGISVQSQHVLSILANYIPEQKFILIFRWETINDQATDDVWDLPKEQQKFIEAYDEIRRTGVKKDEYGNYIDEEVRDFPGSKTMQLFGFEWIYDDDYRKYDYLRLYEEEVFNNLKVFEYGIDQYDEDEIRTEPSLILDVEQYKRKLTFL